MIGNYNYYLTHLINQHFLTKGTFLVLPQNLTITKRFTGGTAKIAGKTCEPFIATVQNTASVTSTVIPQANNAVSDLQNNPNPNLPLANITQPDIPPTTNFSSISQTTSQGIPHNNVKQMVRDSYNTTKNSKLQSTTDNPSSFQETVNDFIRNNPSVSENPPSNIEIVIGEVNRIVTSQTQTVTNTITQEQQIHTSSVGSSSFSKSNSGPLATQTTSTRTSLTPDNTSSVPHTHTRGYASAHNGRLKKHVAPLQNSKSGLPESDTTGAHTLNVLLVCPKEGCKDQNCATGTQLSTGNKQPNACGESTTYHQQSPTPHVEITMELAGNATSHIPSNKNGIVIDPSIQMNNNLKPQEQVTEKHTVIVPVANWVENKSNTGYVQKDDRTKAIINGMPSDSIINQK